MKNLTIEIKWALIFVVMGLLWMLMEKLTGLHDVNIEQHSIYTNLIAIPSVLIYVLALLDKRKNFYCGAMTYIQGFVSGLIITAIVTILTPLTQYITSTFISPDYFSNMVTYSVENDLMPREAAEEYFNLKNYIIQSTMFVPVVGIVTSAIVALFVKKKEK